MNKTRSILFYSIFSLVLLISCKTTKVVNDSNTIIAENIKDQKLIDSILQYGLDREAIYTILGDTKPMSSLASYSFSLANPDSTKTTSGKIVNIEEKKKELAKLQRIQDALNNLKINDLKFVFVPYKSSGEGTKRLVQISVVRESAFNDLLQREQPFFAQFGFAPGADPATVVTATEYGSKYERYRGYGYLFGYPEHAVDFYVKSAETNEKDKTFIKRKFFQIPVYSGDSGYFVYAHPTDYTPTKVDSTLYNRSVKVLDQYKKVRSKYLNEDGSLRSYELIKNFKEDTKNL